MITLEREYFGRFVKAVATRDACNLVAYYAEGIAKQCRDHLAERPWSDEAEILAPIIRAVTRDAERYREMAIDAEIEWERCDGDLDKLDERFTQN